jgi:hypothetical protein
MKDLKKILKRTDVGLIQFFVYIGTLIYLLLSGHGLLSVIFAHLFFVVIYGIIYFRQNFLLFSLSPITAVFSPIQNYLLEKYLRNFKQNIPADTVVILGQSDWFKLEGWIKLNFLKSEIEELVKLLKAGGRDFSFYSNASFKDVEKIMSDKNIKEVYFLGHGDSHTFQLKTDEFLYYCDFNDPKKYGKEFVHQVHCGTPDGKSLIDYVVPKENRDKCFLFRRPINSLDIEKEFKKRTKDFHG